MKIKIGFGYDIHRLQDGRGLYLGGLEIPFKKGLLGHSDGDCLIHAIIDALLGAIGDVDIGQYFPDTDPKYKDIRSTELLEEIIRHLDLEDWEILNIDSLIIAEEPKIAPLVPWMKDILCPILRIETQDLGIKAKTNEGHDAVGRGEAIAAWATALLRLP